MNYEEVSREFSEKYPDYRNDISNFNEYLKKQWKNPLSDENIRFLLQGLDVEFLLDSLIYNIEEKVYRKRASAKKYVTVIGQFFNYIRRNTDINNPTLFDAISYNRSRENTYMKRMLAYIDGCEALMGTVESEALSQSEAERILYWADSQLTTEGEWYKGNEPGKMDETAFKKAMAALGMKMMLIYGLTYRELRRIKVSQYDGMRNTIWLGEFELRLPINMAIQMRRMKDFLDRNGIENEQGYFFINLQGRQWGEITTSSGIPDYLAPLIESTSITGLVKYGITQLLKVGLNDSVIKKITGASDKLIEGCIDHREKDVERIINTRLVNVELYNRF